MKMTFVLIMLLFSFIANCSSAEMNGKTLDDITGEPIGDAVILVQWTMTKGLPGQSYHEVHKIVELVSDSTGSFKIPVLHNPLLDPPIILIFKEGFVPWRNDYMYSSFKKKPNFKWGDNRVIRLSKLSSEYSKKKYNYFLSTGIIGSHFESTPLYSAFKIKTSKAFRQEINKLKNK